MRILHICQRDDPDTGGSLRVAEALVREQRLDGLDVWLLFLYGPPSHIAKQLAPQTVCLGLKSSKQAFFGIPALRRAIKRINPDIIHSHDGIMWPRLAFMLLRIPVVMHSHLPVEISEAMKSKVGWMLIKKTTDLLIGISLHTVDTWVKAGFPPSRIHYVPNGVDFERFNMVDEERKIAMCQELGLPVGKHLLLWMGRLHRTMKGSDRVERVARLLPDDMVLVVVGNGPEYRGMVERCSEQIAAGKLVMAGTTSTPQKYYQAADFFLFTSYHEPFGLVILEAVACCLPIIAFPVTNGGGAVELLEEFAETRIADSDSDAAIRTALETQERKTPHARAKRKDALALYAWGPLSKRCVDVYSLALTKKL